MQFQSFLPSDIWISVAEPSGDMHAADLVLALKQTSPGLVFRGIAGPSLESLAYGGKDFNSSSGTELTDSEENFQSLNKSDNKNWFNPLFNIRDLSVMGGTEVLTALPRIFHMLGQIKAEWHKHRPDAVILVDAPDFNFFLARIARKMDIPVYYYISPKIWAWRSWRANFLRKFTRKIFCILPFEPRFYARYGLKTELPEDNVCQPQECTDNLRNSFTISSCSTLNLNNDRVTADTQIMSADKQVYYVGNPLVAAMQLDSLDRIAVEPLRIGLMPGSRKKEITTLLPIFARAAGIIQEADPKISFYCIQAPGITEDILKANWSGSSLPEIIPSDKRYEFIRSCRVVIAASGTAALECALAGTPAVVAYKLSWITGFLLRFFLNVRFVSLPNLILDHEVFPELLQSNARPEFIAAHVLGWLRNAQLEQETIQDLEKIRKLLGEKNAPQEAARLLLADYQLYKQSLISGSCSE